MARGRPFVGWDYKLDKECVWTREEAQALVDQAHSFNRSVGDLFLHGKDGKITHEVFGARVVGRTIAHDSCRSRSRLAARRARAIDASTVPAGNIGTGPYGGPSCIVKKELREARTPV